MVERRSPKPNVEGSSPSWPVLSMKTRGVSMSKIVSFGKECAAELRKVVWPTRVDVSSSVKVVVVSTILVAFFLGVIDAFFVACLGWLF